MLGGCSKDEYESARCCGCRANRRRRKPFWPGAGRAYGSNLSNRLERVPKDLQTPELPFFLLQVVDGEVRRGMTEVSRKLPGVMLLPHTTDERSPFYLEKYPVGHYNATGMKRMGELFAEAYLKTVPLRVGRVSQR